MAVNKIVHEPGKYFDCTSMHGKWCTITMRKRKKEKPDSADRLRSASFGRGDYRDRDVSDAGRSERV